MKLGEREFQIYLLARMRAKQPVLASLRNLRASESEVRAIVSHLDQQLVTRRDLAAYVEMLGEPRKRKSTPVGAGAFRDSTRWYFALGLWPMFYFAVNETPAGVVWGEEFERRQALTAIGREAIKPWQVCLSDLDRPGIHRTLEDGWDDGADWEVSFGDEGLRFRAAFNWGLLQLWEAMGENEQFFDGESLWRSNWVQWVAHGNQED